MWRGKRGVGMGTEMVGKRRRDKSRGGNVVSVVGGNHVGRERERDGNE